MPLIKALSTTFLIDAESAGLVVCEAIPETNAESGKIGVLKKLS